MKSTVTATQMKTLVAAYQGRRTLVSARMTTCHALARAGLVEVPTAEHGWEITARGEQAARDEIART